MTTVDLPQEQPIRKKAFGLPVDTMLLVVVGALLAFGLMMVYSATFDWSYQRYGSPTTIFIRQLEWLALGLTLMFIAARLDYRWWKRLALPLMALTLGALVWVLVFGSTVFGAQRSFFRGSVQPSELAKFVIIVYLAAWLDSRGDKIREMGYGLIPFAMIVGVVAGLILLQPDLSAAATVLLVATLMFFISGADIFQMGLAALFGSATIWGVLQVSATGRQRLADYLAGLQDLTQASWHIKQAAIAFVNGGLFGRGLGQSHQKFVALPTPHTDSIFAVIGEELGVAGCLFVIALFAAFAWRGFKITAQARDPLGAVLAAGIVAWVSLEAFINVAVMVGILPFAGNALPFISYGGSNLVVTLTAMGVLLSISRRRDDEAIPRKTRATGILRDATAYFGGRNGRGRVSRLIRR
jgi:cell division protein FtsW